ncbi:MAG: hypothetical protein CM1200mP34_3260 [Verrucomicrobiales bacterium]|nr:MAG: hypothetical protein CM1200mP34_3260 [Verrucomicrobiales bacterium]
MAWPLRPVTPGLDPKAKLPTQILGPPQRPLAGYLTLYKDWVERFKGGNGTAFPGSCPQVALQMAVNMALVAGVILGAAYLARLEPAWLAKWNMTRDTLSHGPFWGAGLVLSLPMLIANLRKLQALGMLISGANPPAGARARARARRHSARWWPMSASSPARARGDPVRAVAQFRTVAAARSDAGIGGGAGGGGFGCNGGFSSRLRPGQIALKETFEANELGQAEAESADLPTGLLEAAHLEACAWPRAVPRRGGASVNWRCAQKPG